MQLVPGSQRMFADDRTDPVEGRVCWAPAKSLWITAMTSAAVVFGPLAFSWDAFLLFVATSAISLCFGHSVGMHRRLIHESFDCPLWLEHVCVYLGTLVGMAGPIGMVRIHDFRDWAQRQPSCHDYSCHRASFWRDAWWQLHCRLALAHADSPDQPARATDCKKQHGPWELLKHPGAFDDGVEPVTCNPRLRPELGRMRELRRLPKAGGSPSPQAI
jgi:hypothetical protein